MRVVPATRRAKRRNAAAAGVIDENLQAVTKAMTMNGNVCGGTWPNGEEDYTAKPITDIASVFPDTVLDLNKWIYGRRRLRSFRKRT